MARSKAYLFGGVEIRWSCDPSLIDQKLGTPDKAVFHFPGGLKDYLTETTGAEHKVTRDIFAGRTDKNGGHGTVEWAITWYTGDAFVNSYCNTVPTPDGGTHEAGFRIALTRGLKAYAELTGNKRASMITTDDVMISAAGMLSVFVREPEFVGQTKDKLATVEGAAAWSRTPFATPSTTISLTPPRKPASCSSGSLERADERRPPAQGERGQPQVGRTQAAAARQAG